MSEKLLPCPFCGGEASAEQCVRVDYYGDWVVCCDNEQCCAKPEVLAAIKSAAIAAWNRRTPAPEGEAWRTVPVEPTEAMIAAANALWGEGTGVNYVQLEPEDFYAAMLAASTVVPVMTTPDIAGLCERLRDNWDWPSLLMTEAADTLERQAAEIKRLREALHFYADHHDYPNAGPWGINSDDFGNRARAALTGEDT